MTEDDPNKNPDLPPTLSDLNEADHAESPTSAEEADSAPSQELFQDDDEVTADSPSELGEYEEVPQDVLDRAVEQVTAVAVGNNTSNEDIEFKKFEGRVHRFKAVQHYTLEKQVSEKDAKGKMKGTVVGSRDEAMREIGTHLEKMSNDQELIRNTIQVLKSRKDLGFAIDNEVIRLDKHQKTYVMHSTCNQCGGTASINCAHCQGRREMVCKRCNREGTYVCPVCTGSQFVNGPEGRVPCVRCQGRGRISCEKCQGKGMAACHICKASGKQQCSGCNATGSMSHIVYMQVSARSKFGYDKQMLPEELIEQIELLGPDIVTRKHAQVMIMEDEEIIKEESHEDQRNEYHISYQVKIPFGDIEFSVKKKPIKGKLFGYRPKLLQVPPFLEKLAAKGFKNLSEAASGKGNVTSLLKKSLDYNVLKDILYYTATQSMRRADTKLATLYPFGIRQKATRDLIKKSQIALKQATQKPVTQGLSIGAGAASALLAVFYMSPIQNALSKAIDNVEVEAGLDALVFAAACTATLLAFRYKCKAALTGLFGDKLKEEQLKKLSPATPGIIYGVFAGLAVVQIIMIEIGLAINETAPFWYQVLRREIGL